MVKKQSALRIQKPRPSNLTDAEKRVIRELYAAGYTGWQIERMTGIGHTSIYKTIGRTRASSQTWTDDELQVLADGYFAGLPAKEIAKKVQKSEIAVRVRMCRYRKQVKEDKTKQKVMQYIAYCHDKGLRVGEILKSLKKADILREVAE